VIEQLGTSEERSAYIAYYGSRNDEKARDLMSAFFNCCKRICNGRASESVIRRAVSGADIVCGTLQEQCQCSTFVFPEEFEQVKRALEAKLACVMVAKTYSQQAEVEESLSQAMKYVAKGCCVYGFRTTNGIFEVFPFNPLNRKSSLMCLQPLAKRVSESEVSVGQSTDQDPQAPADLADGGNLPEAQEDDTKIDSGKQVDDLPTPGIDSNVPTVNPRNDDPSPDHPDRKKLENNEVIPPSNDDLKTPDDLPGLDQPNKEEPEDNKVEPSPNEPDVDPSPDQPANGEPVIPHSDESPQEPNDPSLKCPDEEERHESVEVVCPLPLTGDLLSPKSDSDVVDPSKENFDPIRKDDKPDNNSHTGCISNDAESVFHKLDLGQSSEPDQEQEPETKQELKLESELKIPPVVVAAVGVEVPQPIVLVDDEVQKQPSPVDDSGLSKDPEPLLDQELEPRSEPEQQPTHPPTEHVETEFVPLPPLVDNGSSTLAGCVAASMLVAGIVGGAAVAVAGLTAVVVGCKVVPYIKGVVARNTDSASSENAEKIKRSKELAEKQAYVLPDVLTCIMQKEEWPGWASLDAIVDFRQEKQVLPEEAKLEIANSKLNEFGLSVEKAPPPGASYVITSNVTWESGLYEFIRDGHFQKKDDSVTLLEISPKNLQQFLIARKSDAGSDESNLLKQSKINRDPSSGTCTLEIPLDVHVEYLQKCIDVPTLTDDDRLLLAEKIADLTPFEVSLPGCGEEFARQCLEIMQKVCENGTCTVERKGAVRGTASTLNIKFTEDTQNWAKTKFDAKDSSVVLKTLRDSGLVAVEKRMSGGLRPTTAYSFTIKQGVDRDKMGEAMGTIHLEQESGTWKLVTNDKGAKEYLRALAGS
jgi:hypothetical protein